MQSDGEGLWRDSSVSLLDMHPNRRKENNSSAYEFYSSTHNYNSVLCAGVAMW